MTFSAWEKPAREDGTGIRPFLQAVQHGLRLATREGRDPVVRFPAAERHVIPGGVKLE